MKPLGELWEDPRLVYAIALAAVLLLTATIVLFRRRKKTGRGAALVCLLLSLVLHAVLIYLVPLVVQEGGTISAGDHPTADDTIEATVAFSNFDPQSSTAEAATSDTESAEPQSTIAPLPLSSVDSLLTGPPPEPEPVDQEVSAESVKEPPAADQGPLAAPKLPQSLSGGDDASPAESDAGERNEQLTETLAEIFRDAFVFDEDSPAPSTAEPQQSPPNDSAAEPPADPAAENLGRPVARQSIRDNAAFASAPRANVVGGIPRDFAARTGQAKQSAIAATGGDAQTEAAVEAALKFLTENQRPDGSFSPAASGGGRERRPLNKHRPGAGTKSQSALTGLAVLSLLGAGHTHQSGDYADNLYRGLAYLIGQQAPNGSLAGPATRYEATYCHSMASLAMGEAAAITRDASAVSCLGRAINHSRQMQHPVTGGWRYQRGDPGDLSLLGWQAMVMDAGAKADLEIDVQVPRGIRTFLRSVRSGRTGGLATYRPGESPSRTMTAESLATRLLIGEQVPQAEIDEAERYLLEKLPGTGQDNYYFWYYATLALHQLQDEAWDRWNIALKRRLLSTQRADGSWPTDSVWGGYGGSIYTTAMATLCLEVYYRHTLRSTDGTRYRIARDFAGDQPSFSNRPDPDRSSWPREASKNRR